MWSEKTLPKPRSSGFGTSLSRLAFSRISSAALNDMAIQRPYVRVENKVAVHQPSESANIWARFAEYRRNAIPAYRQICQSDWAPVRASSWVLQELVPCPSLKIVEQQVPSESVCAPGTEASALALAHLIG